MRIVLVALSLVACTPPQQEPDVQRPTGTDTLFRQVDVAPFGTITLGSPFAGQTSAPVIEVEPRHFLLIPEGGQFADTDSLFVLLDTTGRVAGMRFVYELAKDFDATVLEYTQALGQPTERIAIDSAGVQLTRMEWSDANTAFELTRAASASGFARVSSLLLDRSTNGQ